jgi:hypothetical protein
MEDWKISLVIKACKLFQQTKKWQGFNLIQIIMISYNLQQSWQHEKKPPNKLSVNDLNGLNGSGSH